MVGDESGLAPQACHQSLPSSAALRPYSLPAWSSYMRDHTTNR